jgi:hypothetical protein
MVSRFHHLAESTLAWFLILLALSALFTTLIPLERTLGSESRMVYFHGAWVWTALIAFLQASIAGFVGLITHRDALHQWSRAWGRTALIFWIVFLPISLYIMQSTWNGLFLVEPRWRISFNFALIGLALQAGLSLLPIVWTSVGNLLFGIALAFGMTSAEAVLHPESPLMNPGAGGIRFFFIGLVLLLLVSAWQLARWWRRFDRRQAKSHE